MTHMMCSTFPESESMDILTPPERLGDLTQSQVVSWNSLDLMRYLSCLHKADGMEGAARNLFSLRYPRSLNLNLVTKAAVAAGTTTDATWAGPLAPMQRLVDDFLAFVRPRTLLGKIQNLRKVPFNISVTAQTAGGTYGWVGQGKPAVVSEPDLATVSLGTSKASGIIVVSEELMKLGRPGSETLLRDELAGGLAKFTDAQLVDPAVAAVADVSPGSILNGTTPIASAGGTAANALTDIKALIANFTTANPDTEFAVFLMSPANAVGIAIATGLPDLGLNGGVLFGIPVVTSTALGTNIAVIDPAGILYADDGGLDISVSRSATVQMDSTPTDPTVAATVLVSLYQMNLVGLRVTRFINWARGRASAARYISGATYV